MMMTIIIIINYLITKSEDVIGKSQTKTLLSLGQYGRLRFEIFP